MRCEDCGQELPDGIAICEDCAKLSSAAVGLDQTPEDKLDADGSAEIGRASCRERV